MCRTTKAPKIPLHHQADKYFIVNNAGLIDLDKWDLAAEALKQLLNEVFRQGMDFGQRKSEKPHRDDRVGLLVASPRAAQRVRMKSTRFLFS